MDWARERCGIEGSVVYSWSKEPRIGRSWWGREVTCIDLGVVIGVGERSFRGDVDVEGGEKSLSHDQDPGILPFPFPLPVPSPWTLPWTFPTFPHDPILPLIAEFTV